MSWTWVISSFVKTFKSSPNYFLWRLLVPKTFYKDRTKFWVTSKLVSIKLYFLVNHLFQMYRINFLALKMWSSLYFKFYGTFAFKTNWPSLTIVLWCQLKIYIHNKIVHKRGMPMIILNKYTLFHILWTKYLKVSSLIISYGEKCPEQFWDITFLKTSS